MNYFVIPGLKKEYIDYKRLLKKESIIKIVCQHFNISKTDLFKRRRYRKFSRPRFIAYHMLFKYTSLNKCEIGELFNMDHTSVIHGIKKIKALASVNDSVIDDIMQVEAKVKAF